MFDLRCVQNNVVNTQIKLLMNSEYVLLNLMKSGEYYCHFNILYYSWEPFHSYFGEWSTLAVNMDESEVTWKQK